MEAAARERGRPRDPRVENAILAATRKALRAGGYSQLTIEGVASSAGVAKTSVYRRWPSKSVLVWDAVFGRRKAMPMPDGEGVEEDIQSMVSWGIQLLTAPEARAALLGLLADLPVDERLRRGMRQAPSRERLRAALRHGVEQGELRSDVDLELLADVIAGAVFIRTSRGKEALGRTLVSDLVDLILRGAASKEPGQRGATR